MLQVTFARSKVPAELLGWGRSRAALVSCRVSFAAQQTASSSGHGRREAEERTDLFHEINGVTLGVNSLFTNISSSVFHLTGEGASYPQPCPSRFSLFASDAPRRAKLLGSRRGPQSPPKDPQPGAVQPTCTPPALSLQAGRDDEVEQTIYTPSGLAKLR